MALFLLSILVFVILSTAQTCYFPNSSIAAGAVPCFSSTAYSACCSSESICLTNGLCMNIKQPFVISRGSCTDEKWGKDCPQQCIGSKDNPGGGVSIVFLVTENKTSTYCCNGITSNGTHAVCQNNEDPFTLENGNIVTGRALLANFTVVNSSSSPLPSNISNTTMTVPYNHSICSSNSSLASTSFAKDTVAVGIGVGMPLGLIALAAFTWGLCERRRRGHLLSRHDYVSDASFASNSPVEPIYNRVGHAGSIYGKTRGVMELRELTPSRSGHARNESLQSLQMSRSNLMI